MEAVRQRIREAALKAGREPETIRLLAVSKTRGVEDIRQAIAAGCGDFGESYVQEALPKIAALSGFSAVTWHFIGPLQSNKTAAVAAHFDWVHSIETEKVALRLNQQRDDALPALNVCIQVNISGEASKSGVKPNQALSLAKTVAGFTKLRLRGLMTIPPLTADREQTTAVFSALRDLYATMQAQGLPLDTLSMGMSKDFEWAIAEGSTLVRIGSDIFGRR